MMKQAVQPVLNETSPAAAAPMSTAAPDRRRPGRFAQVSPHLIPFLRDAANTEIYPAAPDSTDASDLTENLAPIFGIIVSIGLSFTLWALLIRVGSWIFQ